MTAVRAVWLVCAFLVLATAAGIAEAQSAPPQGPSPQRRQFELAAGATIVGPMSLGSLPATLLDSNGSELPLFRTENRLAAGFGIEANLAFRLTDKLSAEATGSWNRVGFRTRTSADIEGADDLTSELSASRFTFEGSALWVLARRPKMEFFARGGGGWMRELAEGNSLFEDGAVGSVGLGMKYWLSERARGRIRRTGLRLEGRAQARSKGLLVGSRSTKIAPAFAGSLVFGF